MEWSSKWTSCGIPAHGQLRLLVRSSVDQKSPETASRSQWNHAEFSLPVTVNENTQSFYCLMAGAVPERFELDHPSSAPGASTVHLDGSVKYCIWAQYCHAALLVRRLAGPKPVSFQMKSRSSHLFSKSFFISPNNTTHFGINHLYPMRPWYLVVFLTNYFARMFPQTRQLASRPKAMSPAHKVEEYLSQPQLLSWWSENQMSYLERIY